MASQMTAQMLSWWESSRGGVAGVASLGGRAGGLSTAGLVQSRLDPFLESVRLLEGENGMIHDGQQCMMGDVGVERTSSGFCGVLVLLPAHWALGIQDHGQCL